MEVRTECCTESWSYSEMKGDRVINGRNRVRIMILLFSLLIRIL